MSGERVDGATKYDKAAHIAYHLAACEAKKGELIITGAYCSTCGKELETVYCEERLYAVRCSRCQTVTLLKSDSPGKAARRTGRGRAYWKEVTPGSDILFECSNCGRVISSSWGCCEDEDTHGENGCDPTEEWLFCPTCGFEMCQTPDDEEENE